MKLVKGIVAAAMMTLACVGGASAEGVFTTTSSLMLTAWNQVGTSTYSANELGLNLANLNDFSDYMNSADSNVWTKVSTIDASLIGSYSLSDLVVSVYGIDNIKSLSTLAKIGTTTVTGTVLFAKDSTAVPTISGTQAYALNSNSVNNASYYKVIDSDLNGVAVGATADAGADAKDLSSRISTTASLANVASADVILYLYAADNAGNRGAQLLNSGNAIAKIKIAADGGVYMSTVPVPGAVWLLGSALLGAVGLRRKNA